MEGMAFVVHRVLHKKFPLHRRGYILYNESTRKELSLNAAVNAVSAPGFIPLFVRINARIFCLFRQRSPLLPAKFFLYKISHLQNSRKIPCPQVQLWFTVPAALFGFFSAAAGARVVPAYALPFLTLPFPENRCTVRRRGSGLPQADERGQPIFRTGKK